MGKQGENLKSKLAKSMADIFNLSHILRYEVCIYIQREREREREREALNQPKFISLYQQNLKQIKIAR